MFVALSPTHPDPMYKQVTDQIKDAIASGDLKPNERLPSVRELSEALNVSAITVKRAYQDLETEGYILTRAGLGSFVAQLEPAVLAGTQARRGPGGIASPRPNLREVRHLGRRHRPARPASGGGLTWTRRSRPPSLTKHYEDFGLEGVSLTVRQGSVSGVFGPNAAGKSTLLRMLAGQAPVPTGSLRVLGQSYADAERDLKNRVGYVPQESVFYENKTVVWHARFAAPYFARWDGAVFYRLLEEFRINPLKQVKHLSGGQKKLLSLALAFSHGAELLILDEPTAGLDVVHRRSLLDRLRTLAAAGDTTVIVASHITDGLDEIAEDVTFLYDGRVVLQEGAGRTDDAVEVDPLQGRLARPRDRGTLRGRPAAAFREPRPDRRLPGRARSARRPALASGDARLEHASLEDILLSFIKGA